MIKKKSFVPCARWVFLWSCLCPGRSAAKWRWVRSSWMSALPPVQATPAACPRHWKWSRDPRADRSRQRCLPARALRTWCRNTRSGSSPPACQCCRACAAPATGTRSWPPCASSTPCRRCLDRFDLAFSKAEIHKILWIILYKSNYKLIGILTPIKTKFIDKNKK